MNYKKISPNTWKDIDTPGETGSGYKCVIIDNSIENGTGLFLFRDEEGNSHFALDISHSGLKVIQDPNVNGFSIKVNKFNLLGVGVKSFIDISCSIDGFMDEFSEVVKEICDEIMQSRKTPYDAVIHVVTNWKVFWTKKNNNLLSSEEQIGLICEIYVLLRLSEINPEKALQTWVGPSGAIHDFIFSEWSFEIKGTRRYGPKHRINGLDQLTLLPKKKLALISILLEENLNEGSISLADIVESIRNKYLYRSDLLIKLNELLQKGGYNPLHKNKYGECGYIIVESNLFIVNGDFPKLTSEMLKNPIHSKVLNVRYDIDLQGVKRLPFSEINLGDFFY